MDAPAGKMCPLGTPHLIGRFVRKIRGIGGSLTFSYRAGKEWISDESNKLIQSGLDFVKMSLRQEREPAIASGESPVSGRNVRADTRSTP